jgi:branched-chain amino acid aminotransferase
MNERIDMGRPLDDHRTQIKSVTLNGERMPLDQAKISIMSPGLSYAATVFEGIRAYWNEDEGELYIFRLDDHLKRLGNSMKMLRFDSPPSSKILREQIIEDIRANEYREDIYIRIQAFIDEWGEMNATGPVGTSIVSRPRPRAPAFETGSHFGITSWQRLSDNASPPRIKAAANYLNSRLAGLDAKASGYQGAIILTEKGTLSEGPGGCIFLIRDGVLITPGVTSGILESLTRDVLLRLAQEAGFQTVERDVDRTELYIADEVFYCGTGQELVPILSIDRLPVGDGKPGPISRQLQTSYDNQVRARALSHSEWQTPVYKMSDGENQ